MSKYEDIAKKLKALADRGIDGEKVNAEKLLQKLVKKHGLSIEEIEEDHIDYHYFKVSKEHYQLFIQVVASVIGCGFKILRDRRRNGYRVIETTTAIYIEIESKFDFYRRCYEREKSIFQKAFVTKHDLFAKDKEPRSLMMMTSAELAEAMRIQRMAENIEMAVFRKQLTQGR